MPCHASRLRRRNQPKASNPPRTMKRLASHAMTGDTRTSTTTHVTESARGVLRRIFLARVDAHLEHVLLRRQRAGGVLAERARRIVGAVQVQREGLAGRGLLLDVEEAPGVVRGLAGGVVAQDEEEPVVLFERVEAQRP